MRRSKLDQAESGGVLRAYEWFRFAHIAIFVTRIGLDSLWIQTCFIAS